jgi:hypothetical protein
MPKIVKYVDIGGKLTPVYENGTTFPYLCRYRLLIVSKNGSGWSETNMYAHEKDPMHKRNIKALKANFHIMGLDERVVKLIRPA